MAHRHIGSGRAWGWSLFLQVVVLVVEFIGAALFGSAALMADAWHMLSDVGSSTLGWWTHRQAHRPPDDEASYGYQKFEDVSAMIHGTVLIMAGLSAGIESVTAFFNSHHAVAYRGALIIASVGLAANLIGFLMMHPYRDRHLNVRAYWMHLGADGLSSLGVILSLTVSWIWQMPWIEAACGVWIAGYLLKSGLSVVINRELWNRLTDRVDPGVTAIIKRYLKVDYAVQAVHHVHVSPDGRGGYRVSASLHVDPAVDKVAYAEVRQRVLRRLQPSGVTHLTLEITPSDAAPPLVHIDEQSA